jgi:hypothetical protein
MHIYLGKDWQNAAASTVTQRSLIIVEGFGHKLYMVTFISSLNVFENQHTRSFNCYRTVKQNYNKMLVDFDSNTLKLKWSDIRVLG